MCYYPNINKKALMRQLRECGSVSIENGHFYDLFLLQFILAYF